MGNCGSWQRQRRHRIQQQAADAPSAQPELTGNRYPHASDTSYPSQFPNPNPYTQYFPGYYPMPQLSDPHTHYQSNNSLSNPGSANLTDGQNAHQSVPLVVPYVEHQKVLTIHNDVNVKKESLHMKTDEENPEQSLVSFKFDARAAGRITIIFFAKEGTNCDWMSTKESLIQPITITFQQGLGQKFEQPSGSGINFSLFDEIELTEEGDSEAYPLVVCAEAHSSENGGSGSNQNGNAQITFAVFERKDNRDYQVRVKKQILWANGTRYELQEIYGLSDKTDNELERNETGKECIICLTEPRDTTVLPCRHLCMCSTCAKVLRLKTTRCPICRQPAEQLLEIDVTNKAAD